MIYLLLTIILTLAIMLIYLIYQKRSVDQQLEYISKKVHDIRANQTDETLKLFTSDVGIQSLMQSINEMILDKRQTEVRNRRYQNSMRKMLSNISHDLKTPLTVINGYTESLQTNVNMSEDEKQDVLKTIHSRSKELVDLVNVFFDLTKLESEDMVLPLERLKVRDICNETVLAFYDLVTSKNLEMSIDIPETDCYIHGNTDALKRILQNLISNAIEYGSDGKIIGLKVACENNLVAISVWDKGLGIAEKHHDNVFERLYTLDDSRNKKYQGSGLGLTITKRLVEKMNGSISLKSQPNELTEFKVIFPQLTL